MRAGMIAMLAALLLAEATLAQGRRRHNPRTLSKLVNDEQWQRMMQQQIASLSGGGGGSGSGSGGGDGGAGTGAIGTAGSGTSEERRSNSSRVKDAMLKSSKDAILKSSKDALVVTKKSYLKKDWCKTEPLIQRVKEAGCDTRTIMNRFCYGQCNSFYIPKNAKKDLETTAFKSCAFCKPKRFRWITITLNCPGRKPPTKRKRIQRIKKCRCISEMVH